LWDVWTRIAADPIAFEPPSAGFALDWRIAAAWRQRGDKTVAAIKQTKAEGGRIVAIGTTVVRTLESAANLDGSVRAGHGVASGRIGRETRLRVVDGCFHYTSNLHQLDGHDHHSLALGTRQ
jgi:S-adenosylmethionine:tRNA ribosyltransferase-isomerase